MSAPDQSREPCPDRILDDIGGAFGMGAVGGSVFHFFKGVKNSPRGERLLGGGQAVRMNAPRVGGSFAVWGGLFSTFDCSMVYLRQKEDPWNSIFAGAATGGFLQMRHGLRSASRSALVGGVLLALIEGAGLMINRVLANMAQMPPPPLEQPLPPTAGSGGILTSAYGGVPPTISSTPQGIPSVTTEASSSGDSSWGSWVGGWMGGKKEESRTQATETLGSFDPNSGREIPSGFAASSEKANTGESNWGSWTGGWFGGKKEESRTSSSETLGSFETTSGTPMPTFEYK